MVGLGARFFVGKPLTGIGNLRCRRDPRGRRTARRNTWMRLPISSHRHRRTPHHADGSIYADDQFRSPALTSRHRSVADWESRGSAPPASSINWAHTSARVGQRGRTQWGRHRATCARSPMVSFRYARTPEAPIPRSTRATAGFAWITYHARRSAECASDRDSSIGNHGGRVSVERAVSLGNAISRQHENSTNFASTRNTPHPAARRRSSNLSLAIRLRSDSFSGNPGASLRALSTSASKSWLLTAETASSACLKTGDSRRQAGALTRCGGRLIGEVCMILCRLLNKNLSCTSQALEIVRHITNTLRRSVK